MVSAPRNEGGVLIVQVRLSCNLHDMTIEEVVGKMLTSHVQMIDGMSRSLEYAGVPEGSLVPLQKVREQAVVHGSEFFNVPHLFLVRGHARRI